MTMRGRIDLKYLQPYLLYIRRQIVRPHLHNKFLKKKKKESLS